MCWRAAAGSAPRSRRVQKVKLVIYPLLDGGPGGAIVRVIFADGRELNADTPTAVDTNEEGPRK